jgi:serine/threonine protein kinase
MTEASSSQALSEGQTIQWYRVEEVLGRGGFGITYLATDNNLEHRVAIKEYLPTTFVERRSDKSLVPSSAAAETQFREGLARFLSEARTLVKFRHKNIVRVMAVFEANNTAYLVMEYEEGERFKEAVSRAGGADESTLKSLLLNIIDGLEQVHQHGFIHRDIKPVNIIIRHDGSPVLLDFGASRVVNRDNAAPPTSFVSAGFTPLEQYQEGAGMELGPWTDIYSLAATVYYAISGQTPVSAVSRLASFVKKSPDPLVPATEVGHGRYSEPFLEAIDWALQFKIADRPQTLAQWRQAIEHTGPVNQAPPVRVHSARRLPKSVETPNPPRKGVFIRRGLSVAALISLLSAGGWMLYNANAQQRQIQNLLSEADEVFAGDGYLMQSRPLYLQVLDLDSQNPDAQAQIEAIDARAEASVLALAEAQEFASAGSLIIAYASARPDRVAALRVAVDEIRLQANRRQQIVRAESAIEDGQYQDALLTLAALTRGGTSDDEVAVLEQRARAALDKRAEEQKVLKARQLQQEQQRLVKEQRLADAYERQKQRRSDYRQYLNSARWALQNDNIEMARKWFDSASAMQITDAEFTELEARLEAAEAFLQTPLSNYEVSYARGQFNALRRAVELKNLVAIEELVGADSPRLNLFRTLFKRYRQITVKIMDVEPKLDPKRVSATLRIEKMALPNGDVVYPSASYRDSDLTIERQRYTWSPIRW